MPAAFPMRRSEVDQLVALFHSHVIERSGARLVLLHGPAGLGKSRLLGDLRKAFVVQGELVLEGRFTGRQPFDGVASVVCRALAFLDEAGVARPAAAAEIEPLWNPTAPARSPAGCGREGAQERLRLFDGVRRFLAELSRTRPVVVLLHDLHAADEGALELLAWLAENLDVDPALAGAVDDHDGDRFRGLLVAAVDDGPAWDRLRNEALPRSPIGAAMAVQGLDEAGVRAFLSSPEVVDRILSSTQGRPEGLRDLLDLLPENVEDLSLRRLTRLAPAERRVLEVIAVAGRSLPAEAVAELSGHPESMASLVERRVVRRSFDQGVAHLELFRPAHSAALCASADPEAVRGLHGAIGRWLHAQDGPPAEIAEHLLSSNDPGAAWPSVDEAVRRLSLTCAFGQAADLLGRAMELAPQSGQPLREAMAQLVDLHEARGDLDRALFHAGRLKRLHLQAGSPKSERAEAYLRIGRLLTARGDLERGLRMLDRAGRGAGAVALQLASARAEVRYLQSDLDEAEAICVQALDLCTATGPNLDRMRVRNTLGKVRLAKDCPRAAAELFELNRSDAVAAGLPREQARALINLGIAQLLQDAYDDAGARYHEALKIAEEQGDVVLAAMARGNLAVIAHRRQRFSEALEHYHRCIVDLRKVGDHTQLATAVNNLGDLYLVLGDLERAQRMADFSLAAQSAGGSRYGRACNQLLLGDIAVSQERFARAERCFEIAHAILKDLGGQAAHSLVRLGRLALLCGRSERARKLAARAVRVSGGDATDVKAAQGLLLGESAVEDGDLDGAPDRVRRALETFADLGDREGQWRAHLTLARLYRCEGKSERGLHHLEAADRIIAGVAAGLPAPLADSYAADSARRSVSVELATLRIELGILPPPAVSVAKPSAAQVGDPLTDRRKRYQRIVGESPRVHQLFEVIDRIAATDSTVLLNGDSGTGKELIAQAIHDNSHRAHGPFVRVNCAAFVETLLLSELFGHEKGAFTGATARRRGRFELADGGTLFLDEIGDVAPNTQVALLRVLQEREFERVGGGGKSLKVDVRVICATNRNLEEMVASGEFRIDLYYRLKGVTIELPPLRERSEDVPLLASHFLADQRRRGSAKALRFDDQALALLAAYPWPGNVRELENVVRSVSLFADGEVISVADLAMYEDLTGGGGRITTPMPALTPAQAPFPAQPSQEAPAAPLAAASRGEPGRSAEQAIVDKVLTEDVSLADMKKRIETECILQALRETGGNITRAAKLLKMKRPRLSQIIKANIDLDRLKAKEGDGQ